MVHTCLPKWHKRIDAAEKRGHFTHHDSSLANDWHACAVGEAHLPLGDTYGEFFRRPVDNELHKLGQRFGAIIQPDGHGFKEARKVLERIECRLQQLYPQVKGGRKPRS